MKSSSTKRKADSSWLLAPATENGRNPVRNDVSEPFSASDEAETEAAPPARVAHAHGLQVPHAQLDGDWREAGKEELVDVQNRVQRHGIEHELLRPFESSRF